MRPYLRRAVRTFLQTAAGYAVVNLATTDLNTRSAVIGLIISAVSAGIAAAMNLNETETKTESEEEEK